MSVRGPTLARASEGLVMFEFGRELKRFFGADSPKDHGAPLRLKVARQRGSTRLKYLARMTVTDSAKGIGDGLGSGSPSAGYSWYAGI